jgi:hypothetical protein
MEFFFFLDAWQYCYQHNIPQNCIHRKDWKTWTVQIPETVGDARG